MKIMSKRSLAWLTSLLMLVSIFCSVVVLPAEAATVDYVYSGSYVYNWGTREEVATFMSPMAEAWYDKNNTSYEELSSLNGSASVGSVPSSALYKELQSLMKSNHDYETSYNATRNLFQYTDCQNSGKTSKKISSFYSGALIGPAWDGGSTWNREHTWPNSKGDASGNGENDIFMLRPTSKSENSSRGNTAYGESSSYYHPNSESGGKYDLRGDVARIMLFVYCRWGNTVKMWGGSGVMESLPVLLKWVEEDPVDTWELGRNDSTESITGTRNVFVDYPELIFLMFGADIPDDYASPSGEGAGSSYTITTSVNDSAYGSVTVSGKNITATPKAGYTVSGYTILSGSATVVRNGNVFTVDATSDVKIRIDFAPRFQTVVGFLDGVGMVDTLFPFVGDEITMPAYTKEVDEGCSFVGWVQSEVTDTTEMPTYYPVGSKFLVDDEEGCTFYALFSRTEMDGNELSNVFEPYTGALTEGDYLVVGNNAVMLGALTDKTRLQYEDITFTNGNIIAPNPLAVWHIAPNGANWTMLNLSNGSYAAGTGYKSSNQATLITSLTDYGKWSVTAKAAGTYDFYNVGNEAAGVNPLLRHNGSVGFACYAKNTSVGTTIKLYKRAGGTTYYFTGEASAPCQHEYESAIAMEPTCGRDGEMTYTCTLCGDSYVEPIPATGKHEYDDVYDADCNGCGAIREVPEKPQYTPGDLNGDGTLNNRDLALLQKHLNDWSVIVVEEALDVNGDGSVNNRDLAALQRILNS
ncbi:MAG: endonuclease [Clostridia bacterium]|nr:endonuclease [Clostridia bacterium]